MPELPEVATMVRALQPALLGSRVTHVVAEEGFFEGNSTAEVRKALAGLVIFDIARRGKYVRVDLSPSGIRHDPRHAPSSSVAYRLPLHLEELLPHGDEWIIGPSVDAARQKEKRAPRTRAGVAHAPATRPASLLLHLMMTGRYFVSTDNGQFVPPRTRFVLALEEEDDNLLFGMKDTRRFATGRLLVGDEAHRWPDDLCLGPDAMTARWSGQRLSQALSGTRAIKVALLDQSRVAGVGNIYASELLHRVRIRPDRAADSLVPAEWNRLAKAMPELMRYAMRHWCSLAKFIGPSVEGLGEADGELSVYGREGERCRRCRGTVEVMELGGRGTWFCRGCQR